MATYVDQPLQREASHEDIQDALQQKAHELFMQCDKEGKGVITKRDMQNLQGELSLTPDQLEAVFDSLDNDGNNYLTLQEFTNGFGRSSFWSAYAMYNMICLELHYAVCVINNFKFSNVYRSLYINARVPTPRFYLINLILRSYDCNMHVEGLLPANLCLVALFNLGTMFAV